MRVNVNNYEKQKTEAAVKINKFFQKINRKLIKLII